MEGRDSREVETVNLLNIAQINRKIFFCIVVGVRMVLELTQKMSNKNYTRVHAQHIRRYTSSDSHFIVMMSYDVTGDGPMEAPIIELSVPALK